LGSSPVERSQSQPQQSFNDPGTGAAQATSTPSPQWRGQSKMLRIKIALVTPRTIADLSYA
jgi:hypothetical protein